MHSKKSDSSFPFSDPILFVSLPEVFLEVITPELSSPDIHAKVYPTDQSKRRAEICLFYFTSNLFFTCDECVYICFINWCVICFTYMILVTPYDNLASWPLYHIAERASAWQWLMPSKFACQDRITKHGIETLEYDSRALILWFIISGRCRFTNISVEIHNGRNFHCWQFIS